eukprot:7374365-Alexandrium_andersonii.AAC.1
MDNRGAQHTLTMATFTQVALFRFGVFCFVGRRLVDIISPRASGPSLYSSVFSLGWCLRQSVVLHIRYCT